ncbi:MAG: hypothetical protein R3F19_28920 [Verrucomicrobiales bacterium]
MKKLPLLIMAATVFALQTAAGFTDNFDDGNDDGWVVFDPLGSAGIAAPAKVTFPGGGYRLEGNVPAIPDGGPARVFTFLQDEELADFYVSVDLVDWDDSIDQAVGLIGRAGNVGLGETTAYVCNYDPNQTGSNPAGQFQINYVENEGAPSDSTMAAANVKLIADHSYRMIFFGKGGTLTGALYDLLDLTRPVALIQTEEGDARGEYYPSGFVGLFSFSRSDNLDDTSICDATFDNFVRDITNPDEATWPVISRGIPGTPRIAALTPASGANFASASAGILAVIDNNGESPIVANSVKLELNGADVTPAATVSVEENGAEISFPGLTDNTLYAARLLASTEAGAQLVHEWRFDTFSVNVLSAPDTVVIEAENYNFDSGQFLADAGPGTYFDKFGELEVDYFDFDTTSRSDLRFDDFVEMRALGADSQVEEIVIDTVRPGVDANDDYVVSRTEGGEWLNYTRNFAPADYAVYLRAASRAPQDVRVDLVTEATTSNQTLQSAGKFAIYSTVSGQSFEYFRLLDDAGTPVALSLSGEQTLRLTIGGEDNAFETKYSLFMNYIMLVPVSGSKDPLRVLSAEMIPGANPEFRITWRSIPGYNYSVEYGTSTDAIGLELVDLVADDTTTSFVDQIPARLNLPTGFYRVREKRP